MHSETRRSECILLVSIAVWAHNRTSKDIPATLLRLESQLLDYILPFSSINEVKALSKVFSLSFTTRYSAKA